MAIGNRSLFSKSDLYHFADEIIEMYDRANIVLGYARLNNDENMIAAHSGIVFELDLLIKAYKLRELVKID